MKSTSTENRAKESRKLALRKSRPIPIIGPLGAPMVIPSSKPRNAVAMDALLQKSGPHDSEIRANKNLAREQLKIGLDEVRRRDAVD